MKLVMTLLVRNEADVLDWNLRFHFEQGVSFVIATDNNSTDTTPDILRKYEKEGGLHFIREEADDYSQGEWVTRMARLAADKFGADWVINNDADEFWWPRQGDLCTTMASVSPGTAGLYCQRLNFVPVDGAANKRSPFWEQMLWRQGRATNALGGKLPGKVCHRGAPEIRVAQGNHSVEGLEGAVQEDESIEILHYPMRSFAQFEAKIRLGGAAYARNKALPQSVGGTWRHLYGLHTSGALRSVYDRHVLSTASGMAIAADAGGFMLDTRLRDYFLRGGLAAIKPPSGQSEEPTPQLSAQT
jgi:hypothetical protein